MRNRFLPIIFTVLVAFGFAGCAADEGPSPDISSRARQRVMTPEKAVKRLPQRHAP